LYKTPEGWRILLLKPVDYGLCPTNSVIQGSDTTGCFPLPVQFTDMSAPGAGTIMNWEWDFGDGSTSKLANPRILTPPWEITMCRFG
jgi:hypothetical protein